MQYEFAFEARMSGCGTIFLHRSAVEPKPEPVSLRCFPQASDVSRVAR